MKDIAKYRRKEKILEKNKTLNVEEDIHEKIKKTDTTTYR